MIKNLFLALLISTQAYAGLPPTSTQGQSDASPKTKFQFQTPFNQSTDLGGIKTLIETGNGNILTDPGFEASTLTWTSGGAGLPTTTSQNAIAVGTGLKGLWFQTGLAAEWTRSPQVTIPVGLRGKNGTVSCNIKNVDGTANTYTLEAIDGSAVNVSTPVTITNSTTTFAETKTNFIFPASGTIGIEIRSVGATEPTVYIDDCKISLADNIGTVAQAILYGVVKVTACSASWQKVAAGSTLVGYTASTSCSYATEGNAVADTTFGSTQLPAIKFSSMPAGDYRIEYEGTIGPNGTGGTIQTNQFTDGTTTAREISTVVEASVATGQASGISQSFSYTTPKSNVTWQLFSAVSDANNTQVFGTTAKPAVIKVWYFPSSSQQAVSSAQADYDWTAYTPTFTGFGTVTSPECFHSRNTSNLLVRCKFTSGTATAVEARISLPSGLTSADTTKIPSLSNSGGIAVRDINTNEYYPILIEPSVSYVTFGMGSATGSSFVKQNGSAIIVSGNKFSFTASIPIQGWSANQRAPTLIGSVTSNSSGAERIERAYFTNGGSCAVSTQSGSWVTSVGDPGAGRCTVNFSTSTWSAAPTCTCSVSGTSGDGNKFCSINVTPTTSTLETQTNIISTSASGFDLPFSLICIGPR